MRISCKMNLLFVCYSIFVLFFSCSTVIQQTVEAWNVLLQSKWMIIFLVVRFQTFDINKAPSNQSQIISKKKGEIGIGKKNLSILLQLELPNIQKPLKPSKHKIKKSKKNKVKFNITNIGKLVTTIFFCFPFPSVAHKCFQTVKFLYNVSFIFFFVVFFDPKPSLGLFPYRLNQVVFHLVNGIQPWADNRKPHIYENIILNGNTIFSHRTSAVEYKLSWYNTQHVCLHRIK